MSTAIDKTLTRVHDRVKAEEFYEAHQAVRTVVARYLRKRDYAPAIGLLYNSALLLAKSHQTGSASDLLIYMIKVYEDAKIEVTGPNKGRIAEIAWHLNPCDAVIKQLAQKSLGWAPNDADLSHVFGTILLRGKQAIEAEKYLLLGTSDSARLLAEVHAKWAAVDPHPRSNAMFMSRGILGFLSIQNIRNSLVYKETFEQSVNSVSSDPIAEFVSLLISTCQTKDAALYRQLKSHYNPLSMVPAWEPALQLIEQDFFNIVPQRQFNIMDMMGGLMK